MSALAELAPQRLFDPVGGESTLDDVLARVWEGLASRAAVPCPLCGGEMEPEYRAHALPIGGRCSGCGSSLG